MISPAFDTTSGLISARPQSLSTKSRQSPFIIFSADPTDGPVSPRFEARLRDRDKLQTERSRRFVPLARAQTARNGT